MLNKSPRRPQAPCTLKPSIVRSPFVTMEQVAKAISQEHITLKSLMKDPIYRALSDSDSANTKATQAINDVASLKELHSNLQHHIECTIEESVLSSQHAVVSAFQSLRNELDLLRQIVPNKSSIEQSLLQNSVETRSIEQRISRMEDVVQALKQEFSEGLSNLKDHVDGLGRYLDNKIGQPDPQLMLLREEINKKVDLSLLDGQNSLLRSMNNEKQINLIEKKIENLYLMIKNIDLTSKS